jgi:hypothetical protein
MTKTQRDALEAALRFTERKELDRAMVRKMLQEALAEPDSTECFAAPVGWKLVPDKPTTEMVEAFYGEPTAHWHCWFYEKYKAMLSTAPKP